MSGELTGPGLLVPPRDVINGDLIVLRNRVFEVRVISSSNAQIVVELWAPGEVGGMAGAPREGHWCPTGEKIRVIGRRK